MKRYGHLFEQVCGFEPLSRAALEAAKGKRLKPRVARFLLDLEPEVFRLEEELSARTYHPRPYRTFAVSEPKQRMICAADFRDRVVHHAVCKVLEPIFERSFIQDSFACRVGKGSHQAIRRAQEFLRRFPFYLKLDVRKFFDSVDHEILKSLLRRKIKDRDFLRLLDAFIDHPVPWAASGKGIPIGNLTSQHFANFYLDPLDHFIKDDLGVKGYVRYMDDMVLFGETKQGLWEALAQVESFLNERLRLTVKPGSVRVAPSSEGLSFLGFRVFTRLVRLQRGGWRRFRRKIIKREDDFRVGRIDEEGLIRSTASLLGHVRHADTRNLLGAFFENRAGLDV